MGEEEQSLRAALQTEFDRLGLDLTALLPSSPGWVNTHAEVGDDNRLGQVFRSSPEQSFHLNFWADRVQLTGGATDDLGAVAGAVHDWLAGATTRQLNEKWPFMGCSPWSDAVERGEGTEYTWQRYLKAPDRALHLVGLRSFFAAAADEPRLRALHPFTSHFTLGFRRTVGYASGIGLWVLPMGGDRYQVRGPDRRECGVADAAGSVRLALAVLDDIEAAPGNSSGVG